MSNSAYTNPIDLAKDAFEAVGKEKLTEILAEQVPPLKDKISDELEKHAMQVMQDEKSILKEYAERAESAKDSSTRSATSSEDSAVRSEKFADMADQSQKSAETHAKNAMVSAESADRRAKDAESAAQGAGEAYKGSENIAAQVKEYFNNLQHLHETIHTDVDIAQKILNKAEFVLARLEEIPTLDEAWIASIKEANEIIEKMKAEILPDLRREQDLAEQLKDNLTSTREDLRDVQIPRAELALQKLKDDVIPRAEELIGSNFEALVQSIEEAKAKFENTILPEGQRLEKELDTKKEEISSTIASVENFKKEIEDEKEDAKNEITVQRGKEIEKITKAGTDQKEALQAQTIIGKDELLSAKSKRATFDPAKSEGYAKGDIIWLLPPDHGTLWTPPPTEETYPWVMPAEHPYNLLGKQKTYQAQTSFKLYAIRLRSTKDNNTDNPIVDKSCIGESWVVDEPASIAESASSSLGSCTIQADGLKRQSSSATKNESNSSGSIPITYPVAFTNLTSINTSFMIDNIVGATFNTSLITYGRHNITLTNVTLNWVTRTGDVQSATRRVYGEIWGY